MVGSVNVLVVPVVGSVKVLVVPLVGSVKVLVVPVVGSVKGLVVVEFVEALPRLHERKTAAKGDLLLGVVSVQGHATPRKDR